MKKIYIKVMLFIMTAFTIVGCTANFYTGSFDANERHKEEKTDLVDSLHIDMNEDIQ